MRSRTAGSYYHVSNHGARGEPIFREAADYERFLALLYVANSRDRFVTRDLSVAEIFCLPRERPLVDVAAYCLLPDQYQVVFRERNVRDGARRFLHRLSTAYAMYYNRRYKHAGTLFRGSYRASLIEDENGLRRLIRQVHLAPASGIDANVNANANANPRGKDAGADKSAAQTPAPREDAVERASRYAYSSMRDYLGDRRRENAILAASPSSASGGRSRP